MGQREIRLDLGSSEELGHAGGGWAVRGKIRAKMLPFYQGFEVRLEKSRFVPISCSTECPFEILKLF